MNGIGPIIAFESLLMDHSQLLFAFGIFVEEFLQSECILHREAVGRIDLQHTQTGHGQFFYAEFGAGVGYIHPGDILMARQGKVDCSFFNMGFVHPSEARVHKRKGLNSFSFFYIIIRTIFFNQFTDSFYPIFQSVRRHLIRYTQNESGDRTHNLQRLDYMAFKLFV